LDNERKALRAYRWPDTPWFFREAFTEMGRNLFGTRRISMLSGIKDIGELVKERTSGVDERMNGQVLFINLDTVTSKYAGIDIEDIDSEKYKGDYYLWRAGASRGNVSAPFCPITRLKKGENKKKGETTYQKIERWLQQCTQTGNPLVIKAFETLMQNKEIIMLQIDTKAKDFPMKRGERRFLSLKLDNKYLGEHEVFRKCLTHFDEAKRKRSSCIGVCSICGIPNKEVSGKTDVFRFYTIDKPGFITGGFQEPHAWKNFPVCMECQNSMENGRKFLENNLRFKFVYDGLIYFLIPRLLIGGQKQLEEVVDILSESTKKIALKERIKKRITNDENEILEYLSEQKDVLTLSFLFLQRQQSAERILLLIEDVFPSRIRRILESKDYVDRVFNNASDKGFTFGTIRTFFSKSDEGKRENDLNKYFLQIVDNVFREGGIDFSFLAKFYMLTIRKEFINERYFNSRVNDSLMDMVFFENLALITFEEVKDMEESIFSSVFARYGKSFGTPAKRGVFLMGSLTQLLLNKQWSERGAKPFMKKLKSLKMDEKDIKALLPDVQNKLEEYESFDKGKRLIASEASKYLLAGGDEWKMSVDEINFYFACGMNLAEALADIAYSKD
jgi:CRISPR-associated protein Csh1